MRKEEIRPNYRSFLFFEKLSLLKQHTFKSLILTNMSFHSSEDENRDKDVIQITRAHSLPLLLPPHQNRPFSSSSSSRLPSSLSSSSKSSLPLEAMSTPDGIQPYFSQENILMNLKVSNIFNERALSLSSVVRRLSTTRLVDSTDRIKFELELRDYHKCEASALISHFHSNLDEGLSDRKIKERQLEFGRNIVSSVKVSPMYVKFFLSYVSGFAPLLWFSAIIVFISWEPLAPSNVYNLALAVVILIVILVSGSFTFYQELQASNILSSIEHLVVKECLCIRGGAVITVEAADLVVGDIVVLSPGVRGGFNLVFC